ncbi:response regulator transcription factor [Brevibacterium samyangense]|uniref:Response regulator transcription factor n=1 Tax=Brevibacterium samyangense TaxID=366888 RepID=A0ABN2T9M0_9MICO
MSIPLSSPAPSLTLAPAGAHACTAVSTHDEDPATGATVEVPLRVLVVDDERFVRSGISAILTADPGIDVIGTAENGAEAVEIVRTRFPDVVLMDIRMPVMDGIDAIAHMAALPRRPQIVALTSMDDGQYVRRAIASGATGFLLKDAEPEDFVRAVRAAALGESFLSPAAASHLVRTWGRDAQPLQVESAARAFAALAPREREVAELVHAGLATTEIASRLYISVSSVKEHLRRVSRKFGLTSTAQVGIAVMVERVRLHR